MRDIEFRGKRRDDGEWAYGFLTGYYENYAGIRPYNHVTEHSVDPETVGQHTGLKDRRGVKIYEGDIIELYYGPGLGKIKGVVTWKEKDCAFMAAAKNHSSCSLVYINENPGAVEILGNVWDTPKLLGRE